MQHNIIQRFAALGYTLTPGPDGYELAIEPPGAYWTPGPDGAWYVARVLNRNKGA